MEKTLLKRLKRQVPDFGYLEIHLPEAAGKKLTDLAAETPDGTRHKLWENSRKDYINLSFRGQRPQNTVEIDFYLLNTGGPPQTAPAQIPVVKATPPPEKPKKGRKIPFFSGLQHKQAERAALNLAEIKSIRETDLSCPNLSNQNVLTFDAAYCWARAWGMIQKAQQLQFQLGKPLYKCYDRICGQGDGAILAAAVAAGISFDRIGAWWSKEWRKVHNPNLLKATQRWLVSKAKPSQSGYDAKQARKALRILFQKNGADMRMKDVQTELQVMVMQADLKVTFHYSPENPDIELWTVVEDSAITKMHYNQKETISGGAIFLGAIEKNDALGLALSSGNTNLSILSIGTPVRVNPQTAKKFSKLGHAGDKINLQNGGFFLHEKRTEQLVEKLNGVGYQIVYRRLECASMDGIVSNDTSDLAKSVGIESGSGQIINTGEAS
jgi:hypothetical protein